MLLSPGMLLLIGIVSADSEPLCKNPVPKPYIRKAPLCAPDGSRGRGIRIRDTAVAIPDLRCECLPIAIRYNNPGVLKTRKAGYWRGQIGKDSKGHAIFESVDAGIAAWATWISIRADRRPPHTAFSLMSLYAPPDDCVGSVGKPPDCPFGTNPTLEYAIRVARAVNKGPQDPLNLDGRDCANGRPSLYSLFTE